MSKVRRSVNADAKELVVLCEFDGCERKFLNLTGMRTHLKRAHDISHKGRSIPADITTCFSCDHTFNSNAALIAHHPNQCSDRRKKLWKQFICQNSNCQKSFEKYVGKDGQRKGQKFCSVSCSNKVRKKISDKANLFFEKECERSNCEKSFLTTSSKRRFCPDSCSIARGYKVPDSRNMGGLRSGGGRSKAIEFMNSDGNKMLLNVEEIRVAEFLDSTEFKWSRNTKGFSYIDLDGSSRKFYPDFYVEDLDLYVEYKGWTTPQMLHKMSDANERNADLNLLIVVGDSTRFSAHGLCISDLERDPDLLQKFSKS